MQKLKNAIKNGRVMGRIYGLIQVLFIKVLQVFVRPNPKQILFMSYSGRQFSDSPRTAFEKLQSDPAYKDFKFVWAFNDPSQFEHKGISKKISANSLFYFYHLLRSKYWISNTSIERLTPFKHEKNTYIQFWHGVPMKHLGPDETELSPLVKRWYQKADFDYLFTYGQYDTKLFKDIFPSAKRYNQVGQLRKLALNERSKQSDREHMMNMYHLNPNKTTLLYAPTFREYELNPDSLAYLGPGALSQLAKTYNVLYRGHYFTDDHKGLPDVVDANDMDLNDLFILSDVLVTDYSSLLFDFSVEAKPIYLFEADLGEYRKKRGLYISGEQLGLPVATSERQLLEMLVQPSALDNSAVEDVLAYYNPMPAQTSLDFLYEIIPTHD